MDLYKLENAYGDIEIGKTVEVDFEYILVLSIVKVDIDNKIVWFKGVPKIKLY